MHTINIPEVDQVIEHVVIGQNEPCWFHGEPGCGKSQGISSAVARLNGVLCDFRLGQYQTVDFKGYPEVDRATEMTVWRMASTLPFVGNPLFNEDQIKVIFFDEADHGADAVKGIAYQALQERRVGEHVFMPNTFICAAGNRPQDRGVGGKNPPPLNNRATHYHVGPDAQAWVTWAMGQDCIPSELMAFMMFRKDLISTFDAKNPEPAFASARTWEKAGRYDRNQRMPERIKEASIEGAVGHGPAVEYQAFKRIVANMPSLATIRANPERVPIDESDSGLAIKWAVAMGIGGEMANDPASSAQFQLYLDRLDPEFNILSWQVGLKKNDKLLGRPEFIKLAETQMALFAAVNRG
jgi:hypothetical protein